MSFTLNDIPINFQLGDGINFTLTDQAIQFHLSVTANVVDARLLEDGGYRLLEDGNYRILE